MSAPLAYYNEFDPFAAAWLRELIKAGLIPEGEVVVVKLFQPPSGEESERTWAASIPAKD